MFANKATGPTQYLSVVKVSFIAANHSGNPEAIFEFPDKKCAEEFYKNRGDSAFGFSVGGLDQQSQTEVSVSGHFVLTQDKKNPLKFSLTIDVNAKMVDYLAHAHIFSMILACIADYKQEKIKEFYLKSFNLGKLSDAVTRADDKAAPVETIVKELANIAVLDNVVAKDLKFEIAIDVSNLEEETRRYYEGMLELKKYEKLITEAHRNKKEIRPAATTSSSQFSFDQVAVLQQIADERIAANNASKATSAPSSGRK